MLPVLLSEFRCRFTLCLFILFLVQFGLLSGHLLGKSCSLLVFRLFCNFSEFSFSFEGGTWVLIASVPGHYIVVSSPEPKAQGELIG